MKDLLADDFRREHPLGLVSVLVRGHQRRTRRKQTLDHVQERLDVLAGKGAERNNFGIRSQALQLIDLRQQELARNAIDFVDDDDRRTFQSEDALQRIAIFRRELAPRLDHEGDHFALGEASMSRIEHPAIEQMLRLMETGRVDNDQLGIGIGADADDAATGGLRLGADDRDLMTDETVEQGGLADVGPAGEGQEAGAMNLLGGHRQSIARSGRRTLPSGAGRLIASELFEGCTRRRLLALFLAAALADAEFAGADTDAGGKLLGMIGADAGDELVSGLHPEAAVGNLLQLGFVIALGGRSAYLVGEKAFDDGLGGGEAAIAVDRADDGLEGGGEDRGLEAAPALLFALAKLQAIVDADFEGLGGQRAAVNDRSALLGQGTFLGGRKTPHQQVGDGKVQDRVAEKLEAFVMRLAGRRGARMGQRDRQQLTAGETMAERAFKSYRVEAGVRLALGSPSQSNKATPPVRRLHPLIARPSQVPLD